jgi:hypothetical protein
MPVDEKVARLWGKLTGEQVWEGTDPLSSKSNPQKRWYRGPWRAVRIPDPAEQPWKWWVALADKCGDVNLVHEPPEWVVYWARDWAEADTPEAALAAAVAKMAADAKEYERWLNTAGSLW